ncbi:phage terminase, small subunit [Anaerolinea thermolimosa]|uniref:terminase small subunit n=1 Tax=Anaerolinea thermolimosa TaxID=229919 RepID=UPI000A02864C|nr:terminase small subunit [Anaerolinea thermolimosa]GAP05915.1 phage terminase, small subunit [Anaerolinea thermolimosa]
MTANDLTARQKRFIQALLTSKSAREAARQAGVGEKTAYRWLRLPQVQSALAEAEALMMGEVMRRLLGMQGAAADALDEIVSDRRLPAARLQAAKMILDNLLRLRSAVELETRLAELERKLEQVSSQGEPPHGD